MFSEARRTEFVDADSWVVFPGRDKQEAKHLLAFFCRSFGFNVTLGRHRLASGGLYLVCEEVLLLRSLIEEEMRLRNTSVGC